RSRWGFRRRITPASPPRQRGSLPQKPQRFEDWNMTQVTVDATLPAKLPTIKETVELCDPSGKVIGKFVPTVDMSEWEPITPEVNDEELERRAKSDKWYTFEEVMAHLKSLENK